MAITLLSPRLASEIGLIDSIPDWVPVVVYLTGLGFLIVIGARLGEVALDTGLSPVLRFNTCLILSFAGSLSMGLFGFSAIIVGEGWVALPFGITAMISWVTLNRYARKKIEGADQD